MSRYPFEPLIDLSDPAIMRERAFASSVAGSRHCFWLPCPLCGLEFGGHEWMRGSEDKPSSIRLPGNEPGTSTGICPFCTMAGRGNDPRYRYDPFADNQVPEEVGSRPCE